MFSEVDFKSLCEFAPREHDASSATFAFQPNICTETCDSPLVRATGVLLAESQVVVEAEVREHGLVSYLLLINRGVDDYYEYYKLNCDKLQVRNLIEESWACQNLKLILLKLQG